MNPSELAKVPADNEVGKVDLFVARARYLFSADGGAQGDIALSLSTPLPSGALILAAFLKVTTPPTSGGAATIALKSEGAADLQAAVAFDAAPFSSTGRKALTKTFATAPILTTAARNIVATIAAADLTAGDFEVIVVFLAPGL